MAHCSQCVDGADDDQIQRPLGVKYDDFDDHVSVVLAIPGVKKPGGAFSSSSNPKGNTAVDAKFYERSLRIDVQVQQSHSLKIKYLYKVKQLPERIFPHLCTYKVGKNKITLKLQKVDSGSWRRALDTKGLETADDF